MEMTKKFNLGILVCLVIILGNMGARFFLLKDQVGQVAELQQTLSRFRNPSGLHRILEKKTGPGLENDIEKIFGEIPSIFHLISYGTDIRKLMDKNRLSIRDSLVFIPAETQVPKLIRFNTRIAADGLYPDIKAFLADVCNLPGLVYINTVQLERQKEDRSRIHMALELSLIFQQAPHLDVRDFSNEE
jgi:Tfp pilus assembly protein PilO